MREGVLGEESGDGARGLPGVEEAVVLREGVDEGGGRGAEEDDGGLLLGHCGERFLRGEGFKRGGGGVCIEKRTLIFAVLGLKLGRAKCWRGRGQ